MAMKKKSVPERGSPPPCAETTPAPFAIDKTELADILDAPAIQSLMDAFFALEKIGMAIVDLQGRVLVATGWQDICTKFHRVHPEACQHCVASDVALSAGIAPGEFKLYRCQNNLWDMATPIVVGGRHVGNLFLGQFFFDDELPDMEIFRAQARRYGFDEPEYLAALDRVPRWSREKVDRAMTFYAALARQISALGYRNLQLTRALADQKQAELKLDQNDALLRLAGKTAAFGGWSVQLPENRVIWSDEVAAIHDRPAGYSPPVEEGLSYYAPEWREKIARAFRDCASTGTPYDEDMEIITATGRRRWVRAAGVAVRDTAGRIVQVQGSFQDITDRKRLDRALQESEEHYRLLVENAQEAVYVVRDGKIVFANAMFARLADMDAADVIGTSTEEFVAPEDRAGIRDHHRRLVAGEPVGNLFEIRVRTRKGAERWVAVNAARILWQGQPATLNFAADITGRKRTEERLRLHAQLLDGVRESVVASDLEGRILYWGRGAEKLYGYPAAEVLGRPYRNFAGASEPPDEEAFRKEILAQGSWQGEHRQKNRGGETFWTSTFISLFMDEQGRPAGYIGIDQDITDRKQAEETLRESEERFRQVAETAEEWIWEMDAAGVYTYSNPVVAQILGYAPEELVGRKNFIDLIAPAAREEVRKSAAKRSSRKEAFLKRVNPVLHKDGHVVFLETTGVPILDPEGHLAGYRGADTDVTERKRAEEALRDSESRLQKIFDILPIGLWLADKNGKLLRGNPAGVEIWGAEPRVDPSRYGVFKARRLPSGEEIAPDDWALAHAIREGTTTLDELLEIDAFDGRKKIILNSTAPVLDDNGAVQGAVIVNQDVTAHKQAEAALQDSEALYRSILNASPDDITITDLEGRILMVSPSALKMFGCERADQLVGHMAFEFIDPGERERAAADIAQLHQGATSGPIGYRSEYRGLRADGSTFDIEVNGEFIRDAAGRPVRMILIVRDVTDRKRIEEALKGSETRYRTFIDTTSDLVFLKDETFRYLISNHANCAFLGKAEADVIGRTDFELMPPEAAAQCHAGDQKALLEGKSVTAEETVGRQTYQTVKFPVPLPGGRTGVGGFIRDITDRKLAEEKLRASMERFRDVAANIPGVIYQLQTGRTGSLEVPYMSSGYEALFERPLAGLDFTGLLFDQMHVGDRALFQHSLAKAAEDLEPWNLEFRILPAQNQVKWLRGSANPRRTPQGGILWNGVLLDITELKLAEQSLREREGFQNLLMDTLPTPVYYKDRQGRYLGVNKAFETLFGKTKEQLVGKNVFDISPPELAKIYHAKDLELLQHPGTQVYEAPMQDAQGGRHDVIFHKASIVDAGGAVAGLIGILLDVTERKRTEEKILQESLLNKTIIDSIPGTFYMLDEAGNYLRWSKYQQEQIVGQPDETMRQTNALSTIHPGDRDLIQARIENVLKNGADEVVEGRVLLRGGPGFRWLLMTGRRLVVEGRPALIGIGIDITERKEAELQVARQLDELRRWQTVTLGREGRVAELKREANALASRLGQPPPYPSAETP
ncbi:MAG: PAS domain S-box protein [Opitutae bacterium]|nr:PAS domain S-box protein [Opitutae bacterium]